MKQWRYDKDNLNVYADGMIAQTYGHSHNGEREANARLIAAAPSMLFALETAVRELGHDFVNEHTIHNMLTLMREAIAKATGGTE